MPSKKNTRLVAMEKQRERGATVLHEMPASSRKQRREDKKRRDKAIRKMMRGK